MLCTCLIRLFLLNSGWTYYWVFAALCSLILLVRIILKPYYFEVHDSRLIINRDLFYQEYVEINDIEKIELEDGLFSKSYIKLKDHKMGLEFNYFIINDRDFNRLKEEYNLQVV